MIDFDILSQPPYHFLHILLIKYNNMYIEITIQTRLIILNRVYNHYSPGVTSGVTIKEKFVLEYDQSKEKIDDIYEKYVLCTLLLNKLLF